MRFGNVEVALHACTRPRYWSSSKKRPQKPSTYSECKTLLYGMVPVKPRFWFHCSVLMVSIAVFIFSRNYSRSQAHPVLGTFSRNMVLDAQEHFRFSTVFFQKQYFLSICLRQRVHLYIYLENVPENICCLFPNRR